MTMEKIVSWMIFSIIIIWLLILYSRVVYKMWINDTDSIVIKITYNILLCWLILIIILVIVFVESTESFYKKITKSIDAE